MTIQKWANQAYMTPERIIDILETADAGYNNILFTIDGESTEISELILMLRVIFNYPKAAPVKRTRVRRKRTTTI